MATEKQSASTDGPLGLISQAHRSLVGAFYLPPFKTHLAGSAALIVPLASILWGPPLGPCPFPPQPHLTEAGLSGSLLPALPPWALAAPYGSPPCVSSRLSQPCDPTPLPVSLLSMAPHFRPSSRAPCQCGSSTVLSPLLPAPALCTSLLPC